MRPFTDLISLSLLIRFSPSTLFVAEQITRSSENLSFIITRNICANDIFLSLQASTVLLVSISRLKKPVCSFESDEMETGFLSGNPEAFISRNVNEARRKGQPKIYPSVGIRQYWLAEFRQLVLNSMQSIRIKFEVTSKSILAMLRRGKVNWDTRVTLRV